MYRRAGSRFMNTNYVFRTPVDEQTNKYTHKFTLICCDATSERKMSMQAREVHNRTGKVILTFQCLPVTLRTIRFNK